MNRQREVEDLREASDHPLGISNQGKNVQKILRVLPYIVVFELLVAIGVEAEIRAV